MSEQSAWRVRIGDREIGSGRPVFCVAEMSANHGQDFDQAVRIVRAAKEAGADAIKLQTYTPETMTLACDRPEFRVGVGTIWEGRTLFDLYAEAHTPWDWQPKLAALARELGMLCFSTPFDATSLAFLESELDPPVHKIASFELVDLPLLRAVGATGKPVIASTGMAEFGEIQEAVDTLREAGASGVVLLKCTSAYPAPPEEMNLRTIPHLAEAFGVPTGLSDHTLGYAISVAAVALGACVVEKHFTLSRALPGPDSSFSLEPAEFRAMVEAIRATEQALGSVRYEVQPHEVAGRVFRRSLFVVQDVRAGELFTEANVRAIRPGHGLPPRDLERVLGRRAAVDCARGTPLRWSLID
jgi:N-acetylneuraminate synthase